MRALLRRRVARLALVATGLFAVAAGIAYATIPDSGGVYTACMLRATGTIRLIDPSGPSTALRSHCTSFETQIQWNQTGPQGPPGSAAQPAGRTVDCAAGQTVTQALADTADASSVDIEIKGTCTESVNLNRDNVNLHGVAPGDGIQAPAGAFAALSVNQTRHVQLEQLTLTGGNVGLSVNGSSVNANGLHVVGANNEDISAGAGSTLQLNDPVVEGGGFAGIGANNGGAVAVQGGTVTGSGSFGVNAQSGGTMILDGGVDISHSGQTGVYAAFSGSIDVNSATIESNTGGGVMANQAGSIHMNGGSVLVQNNGQFGVSANNGGAVAVSNGVHITGNASGGIIAFSSGALQLEGSTVDNNGGNGVEFSNASSGEIDNSTISGNSGDGIHVSDTSVAQFGFPDGGNTVTGNTGWGLLCQGPPSVAVVRGGVGTVSGNNAGQESCPHA